MLTSGREGCAQGRVERIAGDVAAVRLDPAGACAGCEAQGACGVDLSGGAARPLVHVDAAGLAPGQRVAVRAPAGFVPRVSALLFLLPTLALIAGAALGPWLLAPLLPLSTDARAGLGAAAGLVVALLPAAWIEARRRTQLRRALIVTRLED